MRAFDQLFVHEAEWGCASGAAAFAVEGVYVVVEEEAGGVDNERG